MFALLSNFKWWFKVNAMYLWWIQYPRRRNMNFICGIYYWTSLLEFLLWILNSSIIACQDQETAQSLMLLFMIIFMSNTLVKGRQDVSEDIKTSVTPWQSSWSLWWVQIHHTQIMLMFCLWSLNQGNKG